VATPVAAADATLGQIHSRFGGALSGARSPKRMPIKLRFYGQKVWTIRHVPNGQRRPGHGR
jgi:hypothetical protein